MGEFKRFFPYLFFFIFVYIYNSLTLHYGFAAQMDEGYLYTLGKRICDGQIPYLDFNFLRTPLSIYIQALWIALFQDNYTIYFARIIHVLQMSVLVVLISDIYKKYVQSWELCLLLIGSYIVTTMLLQFPWYSYDALFFAGVALFSIHRANFIIAGISICLAGFSKQNYFILLPAALGILVLHYRYFGNRFNGLIKPLAKITVGCGSVLIGYIVLTIIQGNFSSFIHQVIVLPSEVNDISILYALFQDNQGALIQSLPYVLSLVLLVYMHKSKKLCVFLAVVISLLALHDITTNPLYFSYTLVYVNYTGLVLMYIKRRNVPKQVLNTLFPIGILFGVVQYLSGFNYSGLFFAYMGAGIMLPVLYVVIKEIQSRRWVAFIPIILLFSIGLYHKSTFHYGEAETRKLTEPFTAPLLRGVLSTPKQTAKINELYDYIEKQTDPSDKIFVYSDYPALYYITERQNPTRIDWYYYCEVNRELLIETVSILRSDPPVLLILHDEYEELRLFVDEAYDIAETIDELTIYRLKKDIPS